MRAVFTAFFSMSVSGGLLALALLAAKRLLGGRVSRQWQYYIWLVVLLRLLVPFGLEPGLPGRAYQAALSARAALLPQSPPPVSPAPAAGLEPEGEDPPRPVPSGTDSRPLPDPGGLVGEYAWMIWLAAALGLLIRKITVYQSFLRYCRAGMTPLSDMAVLDRLSAAAEQAGVRTPVELCVQPLVSSPMLIGFFRPCILMPRADMPETDFFYMVLHELTHYRRRDMLYKWLVQVTVCLHWFNPLMYLMSREIARDCEFSCDEAVLAKTGGRSPQDYGKTLLNAMAAAGRRQETPGTVSLSENKQLLKERLGAIMNFKKRSHGARLLTGALTLCVLAGAAFTGVRPVSAAAPSAARTQAENPSPRQKADTGRYARMAERAYEAGSLPLFQMAFSNLDGDAQGAWLERIFADRSLVFFGAAAGLLEEDCPPMQRLAEAVYKDGELAYFSILAPRMSRSALESWLDRALEEGNWAFQSVLFQALDSGEAWDALKEAREKEWEAVQTAEYGAVGVTASGKDFYYQGQLVHIFLDARPNKSFYTLSINPKGSVDVKILRSAEGGITGAAYMSEAEAAELLGDMEDPEEGEETVPVHFQTVAAGQTLCLGEYVLSEGDEIGYDILAETGRRMKVFFARDGEEDAVYWSVNSLRRPGEALECAADFTVGPPAGAGTYRLYLQAPEGALGNVRGSFFLAPANPA